jgi:hypothetical protein
MSSTASIAKSSFLLSRIMSPSRLPPQAIFDFHEFRAGGLSGQAASTPVDPKPPSWRLPPAENADTIANCGRAMRVKTSWAMRSPGRTGIASPPWLRFHADIKHGPS